LPDDKRSRHAERIRADDYSGKTFGGHGWFPGDDRGEAGLPGGAHRRRGGVPTESAPTSSRVLRTTDHTSRSASAGAGPAARFADHRGRPGCHQVYGTRVCTSGTTTTKGPVHLRPPAAIPTLRGAAFGRWPALPRDGVPQSPVRGMWGSGAVMPDAFLRSSGGTWCWKSNVQQVIRIRGTRARVISRKELNARRAKTRKRVRAGSVLPGHIGNPTRGAGDSPGGP